MKTDILYILLSQLNISSQGILSTSHSRQFYLSLHNMECISKQCMNEIQNTTIATYAW